MFGYYYRRNDNTCGFTPHERTRPIVKDSLSPNNITKNGHLIRKSIQEGDEHLLVEPHRYAQQGVFLYKRYKNYMHSNLSVLTPCDCLFYGYVCQYCQVLNTSFFYNLEVPLNQEDWSVLKKCFLHKHKWTEKNFHDWLCFWIHVANQHNLIFFKWRTFSRSNPYTFFYRLFQFITSGQVLLLDQERFAPRFVDMNGGLLRGPVRGQRTRPNCVAINTCHALLRFSFRIYRKGGRITRTSTRPFERYSLIEYVDVDDPRNDRFHIHKKVGEFQERTRWKRVFQYTIDQINEEVRFRPGMCGMHDCMTSFSSFASQWT